MRRPNGFGKLNLGRGFVETAWQLALLAGATADMLGLAAAMWLVAALIMLSGVVVAVRMRETFQPRA